MPIGTVPNLIEALNKYRLLEPHQLQQLLSLKDRFKDPRVMARFLLQRHWLTQYQLNHLLQGNGRNLVLGNYVLLDRLGEGGMGKVFKARHSVLHRIVALKVIRREHLTDPEAVHRFRREIRAVSQLSHPNVVMAYDADAAGNSLFLTMEYVEGTDLGLLVRDRGPLPVAEACDCIRQAALGLQHAHERGMVHRDIKPSNLLLTAGRTTLGRRRGVVKILDLGLARIRSRIEKDDRSVTQIGILVGTPDFMAPEQARNAHQADGRADLYSLGCTFYYLLTGNMPFPGSSTTEKLLKSCFDEPEPVTSLKPDVPAPVVAIVNRLMAKQPQDRYQSAGDLAGDLVKHTRLPDATPAPVKILQMARQVASGLTTAVRTSHRHRRIVIPVLCGFLLLMVLGYFAAFRGDSTETPTVRPGTRITGLPKGSSYFDLLSPKSIPAGERFSWQPEELVAVLGEHRGRHWGRINALAVSPDGELIATGGYDGRVRLWQTDGLHKETDLRAKNWSSVAVIAFAPDGKSLAYGCNSGEIHRWSLNPLKQLSSLREHDTNIYAMAYSADGKKLVSASRDGDTYYWDLTSEPPDYESLERNSNYRVHAVAFSPDGKMLATGDDDEMVRLWDLTVDPPAEIATLSGHKNNVYHVAFDPDGKYLVSSSPTAVRVWNVARQEPARPAVLTSSQRLRGLAFTADGKTLALANRGAIQLWNWSATPPQKRATMDGRLHDITRMVMAPKKNWLVYGDSHKVEVLDLSKTKPVRKFVSHSHHANAVAIAPDGRTMATGSWGGIIRIFDLNGPAPNPLDQKKGHDGPIKSLQYSSDGKHLVSASTDGTAKIWDLDQSLPEEKFTLEVYGRVNRPVCFNGSGSLLAVAQVRSVLFRKMETNTPAELGELPLKMFMKNNSLAVLALAPDGRMLVTGDAYRTLKFWDLTGGRPSQFNIEGSHNGTCRFSPNGHWLAAGTSTGNIDIWNTLAKPPRSPGLLRLPNSARALAFSPNSQSLLVGSIDRLSRFDVESSILLKDWRFPGAMTDIAYAPDGRHAATVNSNGTVYILRMAPPESK